MSLNIKQEKKIWSCICAYEKVTQYALKNIRAILFSFVFFVFFEKILSNLESRDNDCSKGNAEPLEAKGKT